MSELFGWLGRWHAFAGTGVGMVCIGVGVLVVSAVGSSGPTVAGAAARVDARSYIVTLKESVARPGRVAARHVGEYGAELGQVYRSAVKGYVARLSAGEAAALRREPAVVAVERDRGGEFVGQEPSSGFERVFADQNTAIDQDATKSAGVDADIAILDDGIDVDHPDLNVVETAYCVGVDPCEEGPLTGTTGHGTLVAGIAAARDNGIGVVGVAPGARLWAVQIGTGAHGTCTGQWSFCVSDLLTGLDYVAAHADEIDVVNMSLRADGPVAALSAAIEGLVEAGVVVVAAAANEGRDIAGDGQDPEVVPANVEEAITVSGVADFDGQPGGAGVPGDVPSEPECPTGSGGGYVYGEDEDDTLADYSNWGDNVDVAAPAVCIVSTAPGGSYTVQSGTSAATPHVAGAAAILTSRDDPQDGEDVQEIADTLVEEGNSGWGDEGGPGDPHEPLLDVGDEGVFDPATVDVDSDVDGDGHPDLVTLRTDGEVAVHGGGEGAAAMQFDEDAVVSFTGAAALDPAQFDGEGHYVVDVADVDGDDRSDLVTVTDDGDVHVFAGESGLTFHGQGVVSELDLSPALLEAGGDEPVAVADVDGDGHGDLILYDDQAGDLVVHPGGGEGEFGTAVVARSNVESALHSESGHYFLDAADVTGDRRADLVSTTSGGDIAVFVGQPGHTLAAAVVSQDGEVEPAMDDGRGYEPIGVGDVTGDGHADLVVAKDGTTYTYEGGAGGSGAEFADGPTASFSGQMPSRVFHELPSPSSAELFSVMDVDGDGNADIAADAAGKVGVAGGSSSGQFGPGADFTFDGSFETAQHQVEAGPDSNEIVIEKPAWRRRGCSQVGCAPFGDSVGVWRQGTDTWTYYHWTGPRTIPGFPSFSTFVYGTDGDKPVAGDWDGDGVDTPAVWRTSGQYPVFYLRNSNSAGSHDDTVQWGFANHTPVAGDWDGDGTDTVGVWDPADGNWYLCNDHDDCVSGYTTVNWGDSEEGDLPVVGDWDGNGTDTVGFWRTTNGGWYLCNDHTNCAANHYVSGWGDPNPPHNDLPVAGDWDGDGIDTIGVWRQDTGAWYPCNNLANCPQHYYSIYWGDSHHPHYDLPIVGNWTDK